MYTVILFMSVSGHRYGADPTACDTMKPGHGTSVRQTTDSPYVIDTNHQGYIPCTANGQVDCGVIVRIRTKDTAINGQFKGFLLQARARAPDGQLMYIGEYKYMNGQPVTARNNANQMTAVRLSGMGGMNAMDINGAMTMGLQGSPLLGKSVDKRQVVDHIEPVALGQIGMPPGSNFNPNFNPALNPNINNQFVNNIGNNVASLSNIMVQRMQCVRGSAITHTENGSKNIVQLHWLPPVGHVSPVEFVATVVSDFNTFWMEHRSQTLNSRPDLRVSGGGVGNTARWYSSANKATAGTIVLVTSLCTILFFLF